MGIAVAYDSKQKLHYVVRSVPAGLLEWDPDADCTAQLNALLAAKTPTAFLRAVDGMPSLYPRGRFSKTTRAATRKSEVEYAIVRLGECDEDQLRAEMWMDSATPLRSDTAKMSKFAADFGYEEVRFAELVDGALEGGGAVVVEHLQDWMTMRNSLTLCARLLAQLQDGGGAASLEEAGFYRRENSRLKDGFYIIPFKFNPFFARASADWEEKDPLYNSLVTQRKLATRLGFLDDARGDFPDASEEDVFFATSAVAKQEYAGIFASRRLEPADKTLYMMVRDSGDHAAMATKTVLAMTEAFRTLEDWEDGMRGKEARRGTGRPLGWEYDAAGALAGIDDARMVPRSFASALWYRLLYHHARRFTICAHCKNAVLSSEKGMRREYCSDTCRVQAAVKERKRGGEDAG